MRGNKMESIEAIDDLICTLCEQSTNSSWTDRASVSIAIKNLCESLAVLGVGRCFVEEIPMDKKGKFKE